MRSLIAFGLSICTALMIAPPLSAGENHAMLVGAATYPNLKKTYWLRGTTNDVDLVHDYLLKAAPVEFAAENIIVLAETERATGKATLAGIRSGFAQLTDTVQPGDFVYLHFSGHGSQAPALNPENELDGLDELFLPVDIGPWENSKGAVQNALVDDEIGALIAAIRGRGATVWAVFDSCHSGTVTRSAENGEDVVLRKLDPSTLGVPNSETAGLRRTDMTAFEQNTRGLPPEQQGDFVAFFAAQTNETTPEMNMPPGKKGRKRHGVFTYTLFEALVENPGITYAQLGQEVLRRYSVANLARSTPLFEGDLDGPVFGRGDAGRLSQWPATVNQGQALLNIPAGTLFGVNAGDELAIMRSPADPEEALLGYAEVVSAENFSAFAKPQGLSTDEIPPGSYLRKTSDRLALQMTVALPQANAPAANVVIEAVKELQSSGSLGPRVSFVGAGEPADLRLAIEPKSPRPDAAWVLPASGFFDATAPSIGTRGRDTGRIARDLGDTLGKMARALNVLQLGSTFRAANMDVSVTLQSRNPNDPKLIALRPLNPALVPRLIPGDEVHLLATNHMDSAIDVNVLYVDASYSISHMWAGRMQPGDTLNQGLLRLTDAGFGRDRVILIISQAQRGTQVQNLSFLAQDKVVFNRGGSASNQREIASIESALDEVFFGTALRSAVPLGDASGPKASVLQFEIDAVPAR